MIIKPGGVIARLLIALVLFLIPILGWIDGPITPLFGVTAVVELATALTRFSPLVFYWQKRQEKREAIATGSPKYS